MLNEWISESGTVWRPLHKPPSDWTTSRLLEASGKHVATRVQSFHFHSSPQFSLMTKNLFYGKPQPSLYFLSPPAMNHISVHGEARASLATMPETKPWESKRGWGVVRNELAQAKINPGIPGKLPGARVPAGEPDPEAVGLEGERLWCLIHVLRMGAPESWRQCQPLLLDVWSPPPGSEGRLQEAKRRGMSWILAVTELLKRKYPRIRLKAEPLEGAKRCTWGGERGRQGVAGDCSPVLAGSNISLTYVSHWILPPCMYLHPLKSSFRNPHVDSRDCPPCSSIILSDNLTHKFQVT